MMTIGSVNSNNVQAGYSGMNMQADSVSKNIQQQIANAQKELQELSSDKEMTAEEKTKKSQEIRQEIANLNQQLRQHQMEQRRERQQAKGTSRKDMFEENRKEGTAGAEGKGSGMSQTTMTAMISADASMKQAQVQGSVASEMNGRAGVLKAEIKQDAGRSTEKKEAELAEVEQKAMNAQVAQAHTLADANQTMGEARESNQNRKVKEMAEPSQSAKGEEAISAAKAEEADMDNKAKETDVNHENETEREYRAENDGQGPEKISMTNPYIPIDIRL